MHAEAHQGRGMLQLPQTWEFWNFWFNEKHPTVNVVLKL